MVSRFRAFIRKHQKAAPVIFFITGFIWDSLTLQRIDRLYENVVLCFYLICLSACLYLYNLADDGKWKETFLEKYEEYFPLAIQFFLGGLCSAYVIFYSRSVSLTKTLSFFLILVVLLFANEVLKQRISNKYLQFGAYFFVNFTFFTFFIPVMFNVMNTAVFIISGVVSLGITLSLIFIIYRKSPTTRAEINGGKITGLILGIYILINTFYYFNLIPPVPLALETGIVAHNVEKQNGSYSVTYEKGRWYKFWIPYNPTYSYQAGDRVYAYASVFAPTDLKKEILHRWQWYNPNKKEWEVTDRIRYEITGGRSGGYRGYTYKSKVRPGQWEVDVITREGLVLGRMKFTIPADSSIQEQNTVTRTFE